MNLDRRITERYASFTGQERRAADVMIGHLPDLAGYRASELAELAGVSKATMSRFVRRLGYETFEEFRFDLRRLAGMPAQARATSDLQDWLTAEVDVLRRAFETIDEGVLQGAAAVVAGARQVVVAGRRTSHPVALYLRQQLAQVRGAVLLSPQPGQSMAEDLVDLGASDVVVWVATRRRPDGTRAALELLREQQVPVLLLADPSAAGLASIATWWISCPLATHGAFDGYAATMAVAGLFADRVGRCLTDGWQQARQIDEAYHRLGEVES